MTITPNLNLPTPNYDTLVSEAIQARKRHTGATSKVYSAIQRDKNVPAIVSPVSLLMADGFKVSRTKTGASPLSLLERANRKDIKRTQTAERVRVFRAKQRAEIIARSIATLEFNRVGATPYTATDMIDSVRIAVNKVIPHTRVNLKHQIIDSLTERFGSSGSTTGKIEQPELFKIKLAIHDMDVFASIPRYTRSGTDRKRSYASVRYYTDASKVPTCNFTDSRAIMPTCKGTQKTRAERYASAGSTGSGTKSNNASSIDGYTGTASAPKGVIPTLRVFDGNIPNKDSTGADISAPIPAYHYMPAHVSLEVAKDMAKLYKQLSDMRLGTCKVTKYKAVSKDDRNVVLSPVQVTLVSQFGLYRADGIASMYPRMVSNPR